MIRELKCPYGDDFEGGDECNRCEQYELCMETYPPVNLIEVPKGATYGDMIKNVLQIKDEDIKVKNSCVTNQVIEYVIDTDNYFLRFDKNFWNAPYKRGNENG